MQESKRGVIREGLLSLSLSLSLYYFSSVLIISFRAADWRIPFLRTGTRRKRCLARVYNRRDTLFIIPRVSNPEREREREREEKGGRNILMRTLRQRRVR